MLRNQRWNSNTGVLVVVVLGGGLGGLEGQKEEGRNRGEDVIENKGSGGQVRPRAEGSIGCRHTGQDDEGEGDAELHRGA